MKYLFITGLYRSGTTWLQKLLNQQPLVQTFEQPCPPFYWSTKRQYYQSQGLNDDRLPISDQFGEGDNSQDLTKWLNQFNVDSEFVRESREGAASFSGTGRLYAGQLLEPKTPRPWMDYWKLMHRYWLTLTAKQEVEWIGSKEIIAEEFCEHLMEHGVKVLLIIRDPRDVIKSLINDNRGFMGHYRSTLYSLRMWRKSVAYAIHLQANPNFHWVIYEDLKKDMMGQKHRMAAFLGIGVQDWEKRMDLLNEDGSPWQPNVSNLAIAELSTEVNQYIEMLCWPEMKYLGYLPEPPRIELSEVWNSFEEPKPVTHRSFDPDYSKRLDELEKELKRLELLRRSGLSSEEKTRWFIHDNAYDVLKETIAPDQ